MSQGLIDLGINHEEFKTIVNENEKYEQMKENIRNRKDKLEIGILEKMVEMHRFQNIHFFVLYI